MNSPLKCEIEDGKLVISIGIYTLAYAAGANKQSGICQGLCYIYDDERFAKDVVKELLRENEVGESLLSKTLDSAMIMAENNGSVAFGYENISER